MATRLAHSIVNALQRKTTISTVYILTDSEIALFWVKNTVKENSAGVYVNNRRREIHQIVKNLPDNVKFGYVSTSMNPADCATRGLQKDELSQHIWWSGPDTKSGKRNPSDLIDWKRYKSLSSCQTSIAYVLRFIRGVISRVNVDLRTRIEQHIPEISQMTTNTYVTAEERKMASKVMTRNHQQVYLSDLRKKNLKQLKLRLDDNGILRCRGRLEKTNLAYDARQPIFIETNTDLARLISSHKHTERFWEIWSREYLTSLRERHQISLKCQKGGSAVPKPGKVVLLVEEVLPRNSWKMGRITKLRESSDGEIREAEVKMPNGRLVRRPLNLLVPLELDEAEEQGQSKSK
ncbi:unnamed protein product, partial [Heligmosomoides polygyrus]|uniref:DUF5641 domain-containing protein n=1 Tax=Heligmosomoides polygyrus TaxID=6339 RepID=A0A183GCK5_HELPZ